MSNEEERVKELAGLLTAFAYGKQLQYKAWTEFDSSYVWLDFKGDYKQLLHKMISLTHFRIKPETKRIALNQQDLIDRELSNKTISLIYDKTVYHIKRYDNNMIYINGLDCISYYSLKDKYIFLDNSPCYKEVEYE